MSSATVSGISLLFTFLFLSSCYITSPGLGQEAPPWTLDHDRCRSLVSDALPGAVHVRYIPRLLYKFISGSRVSYARDSPGKDVQMFSRSLPFPRRSLEMQVRALNINCQPYQLPQPVGPTCASHPRCLPHHYHETALCGPHFTDFPRCRCSIIQHAALTLTITRIGAF